MALLALEERGGSDTKSTEWGLRFCLVFENKDYGIRERFQQSSKKTAGQINCPAGMDMAVDGVG